MLALADVAAVIPRPTSGSADYALPRADFPPT